MQTVDPLVVARVPISSFTECGDTKRVMSYTLRSILPFLLILPLPRLDWSLALQLFKIYMSKPFKILNSRSFFLGGLIGHVHTWASG
jgi:hypothetical protein